MNDITYAVSVDVNSPAIPYNVYVASVLDSNVRYLEITLYQNGNVIALSNETTATASLVTDNVLVDDSVECTISNNIITVPLEGLQRHGNLDVQVTVTEGSQVLAIPFPIQVRVTPNIAEEAQIDENSMGSYAEVVQEIAEARGTYDSLKQRIDTSPSDEQINNVVEDYLDAHPEMFTAGVTPEMFGAKGDGITDDAEAIQEMFDSVPLNALCVFYKNYKINSGIVIDRAVNVLMYGKIIVSNALDFGIRISGHNVRRNKFRFNLEAESYWFQWGTVKYTVKESVSNGNVIYVNQKIENNSYHIGRFLNVGGTSVEILDCGYDEADGVKVYKFQVADGVTCQAGDVIVVEDNTSYNTIGLDLYETWENEFDISLTNFNTGIRLISGSSDCTYNKIFIRNIFDCKKAILLTGDPNHSGGTTAQNTFIGGRIGASSSSYLHLDKDDITDCYFPMKSERIGSRTNNNNNFFGVSFESGFGVQNLPYVNRAKVKADFIYGSFIGCRYEGITGFEAQDFCTIIAGYAFDNIPHKSGNYNAYGNNDCYIGTNSQPIKIKRFGNFQSSENIVELINNNNITVGKFGKDGDLVFRGVKLTHDKNTLINSDNKYIYLMGIDHTNLATELSRLNNEEWGFSRNNGYIVNKAGKTNDTFVIQPIYTSTPTNKTTGMYMFYNGRPMWYNGTNWVYANGDTTFDLPTKTSELQNDSGFLTSHQSLAGYYTKTEIDNKGFLTSHQDISGKEDKSNKVTSMSSSSTDTQYPSAKAVYDGLSGKYEKPSGGIPKSDLASAVQTSLGKADSALQSYTEQYTGTITGITMNGASKGTSGVIDLGTVITSHQNISGKENTSNKVTSLSSNSTDNQYPSAKCVYDLIGNIETLLSQV